MTTVLFDRLAALADPIRCRLLLALERQELTVNELKAALQLPQSTVSRHLRVLADDGWVVVREDGTSNWYRMPVRDLDPGARRLWQAVRDQASGTAAAKRDAERIRGVVAARHSRSQEFFATAAGQWDRVRTDLFGRGLEWLALGGLLDADLVVGDLGTGTGALAAALAPLVSRVIAVDESAGMIKAARERLRGAPNVELRVGTIEALPLDSELLDLAFIVLVLHHVGDPARAVEEVARVLKPGGRVVMVDMVTHERAEYRQLMGHQWLGFDRDVVARWCGDAGLIRFSYRPLPPQPDAKGPLLFVAAAERPS
jgi:ArsR family transcriptional regulator